jgi:hypothetical protein
LLDHEEKRAGLAAALFLFARLESYSAAMRTSGAVERASASTCRSNFELLTGHDAGT